MTPRRTLATAQRVLWQIRRDPRTIALLLAVPTALLVLLYFLFEGQPHTFQKIGAPLCGLFPFIIMFLITSVAMLRERTTGTLERLMTLPLAKADILFGYALAFGLLAAVQAVVVCSVGFLFLGLEAAHGAWLVGILAVANALLGMALGLGASAFARTEFQAVQFMPALILPQLLLCGLFVPRSQMAGWLHVVSWLMPLTYAYDALARTTSAAPLGGAMVADVLAVVAFTLVALELGAVTLRRRTS
jgi:ABC-2 type transport system permease protein